MLENRYDGMVNGVYEGWFIVLYQDEHKARVMWSSMKDKENVVSVTMEDWEQFADGSWGAVSVIADDLGYEYTEKDDIYYYNNIKRIYLATVEEARIREKKAFYYELAIEYLDNIREAAIEDKEDDDIEIIEIVINELKYIKNKGEN